MGVLTMDMSSLEIEQDGSTASQYDEEVLCSSWVQVQSPALLQSLSTHWENKQALPESLANMDVEQFLRKMYSNQR